MRNLLIAAVGAVTLSALVACSDTTTGPSSLGSDGVASSEQGLNSVAWQGHGSDHIDGCVTGYHWILAPAQGITSTPRFHSNLDNGEEMFRMSDNAGENAAWHYNSGLVDTEEGSHPSVTFDGSPHPQVKLILSHCLDGDGATLSVTKTADTEFERVHEWDIDKRVEKDEIWLYTDGSGDETATWTVDVEYEGSFDRDFVIAGNVFITNISNPGEPKTITSIVDDLGLAGYDNIALQCEDASGAIFDPETDLPRDIDPAETWVCSYRVELEDGEVEQGDEGTNTVTVMVDDDPYTGTDGWEFDEPTSVLYDEVDIEDVSELFGTEKLGTVTAPTGASFSYGEGTLFAYADYGDARCGTHEYSNTATIVETGQSAEATLKVNVQCLQWESAWAMAEDENPDHDSPSQGSSATAHSFCENGFSNWGWSNEVKADYSGKWPLFAGAGQCDITKGTEVGYIKITHDLDEGFDLEFKMKNGFFHEDEAVYADLGMFPKLRNGRNTTAPGQYYVADSLEDVIHVIAHINAGIPDPDFGPED